MSSAEQRRYVKPTKQQKRKDWQQTTKEELKPNRHTQSKSRNQKKNKQSSTELPRKSRTNTGGSTKELKPRRYNQWKHRNQKKNKQQLPMQLNQNLRTDPPMLLSWDISCQYSRAIFAEPFPFRFKTETSKNEFVIGSGNIYVSNETERRNPIPNDIRGFNDVFSYDIFMPAPGNNDQGQVCIPRSNL